MRRLTKRQARYEALARCAGIIDSDIGMGGLSELWDDDRDVDAIAAEMGHIRDTLRMQADRIAPTDQLQEEQTHEQH